MDVFEHHVENGHNGRSLTAWVCRVGHDIVITVGGGTQPHVGAVVLTQSHPSTQGARGASVTTSVLTIPPHKEEPVARPIAEAVCRATGRTTVVTAGIHEEGLDRNGIDTYLRLADTMANELAARLGANEPGRTA